MISPLTLRQMLIFIEVARRQSLAEAGRALNLSQPTISEALRDLERGLGCPLFDRTGRRLRLNSAGRALLPDASRIVADTQAVFRRHSGREHLTLGASVTVGNYILPELVIATWRAEPALEISVVVRNTEATVQALVQREIEAALVEGRVNHPDLEILPWRQDAQVIIAAPGHPLAEAGSAEALAGAGWILREPGSGTRQAFDAAAEVLPFVPRIIMTVGGNELLKRTVAAGVGLGCLSRAAVQNELDRGELTLVTPRGVAIKRMLSLVLPRNRRRQPALVRFLDRCRASADPDLWA